MTAGGQMIFALATTGYLLIGIQSKSAIRWKIRATGYRATNRGFFG